MIDLDALAVNQPDRHFHPAISLLAAGDPVHGAASCAQGRIASTSKDELGRGLVESCG
jgi:hypothetical protein